MHSCSSRRPCHNALGGGTRDETVMASLRRCNELGGTWKATRTEDGDRAMTQRSVSSASMSPRPVVAGSLAHSTPSKPYPTTISAGLRKRASLTITLSEHPALLCIHVPPGEGQKTTMQRNSPVTRGILLATSWRRTPASDRVLWRLLQCGVHTSAPHERLYR